jgi:two-component system, OmpR family, sensor kinase
MRVRSLRRRVIVLGLVVVGIVVAVTDVVVALSVRDEFGRATQRLLDAREATVLALADDGLAPDELAERLAGMSVPATVRPSGGGVITAAPDEDPAVVRDETREVVLPDGTVVEVQASSDAERLATRRLFAVTVAGTAVAVAVGLGLLWVFTRRALRPLDDVVQAARATAAGQSGQRLHPERTDTEVGRLAAAFDEMLEAQEAMLERAQVAEATSRSFLADAAHQLRTPIAGLRAAAETLVAGTDPVERDRLLVHVARESARLGRLVDDLLTVARFDRREPARRELADLRALLEDEVERVRTRRPELAVSVEGPVVRAPIDPAAVQEAVANLLDNALRHARATVVVTSGVADGRARVTVRDDGPGLAPGEEEVAFARFVSLDDRGGAGLGLAIAREVAEAHGGHLGWDGVSFVMEMPLDDGVGS